MISLSDLEDDRMRGAKSGNWWEHNGHRALANNSAAYNSKPEIGQFLQEWTSLYNSHSGERGIFSREASKNQAAKNGRRGIKKVIVTLENGIKKEMDYEDAKKLKVGDSL
jgi:ribonucleoside-diphosphate reductase alpha chain